MCAEGPRATGDQQADKTLCSLPTPGLMEMALLRGAACGHSGTTCKLLGSLGQPRLGGSMPQPLYPHPPLTQAQNTPLQERLSPSPPFRPSLLHLGSPPKRQRKVSEGGLGAFCVSFHPPHLHINIIPTRGVLT